MHVNTHPGSGGPRAANGGSWHGDAVPTAVIRLRCGCSWEKDVIAAGSVPGVWGARGHKAKVSRA